MIAELQGILRDAGKIARRHFGNLSEGQVEFKSEADLVTVADREVEAYLRQRLAQLCPDAGFVGEEGTAANRTGDGRWFLVDPIDGTTSFVHGIPYYSISLALKEKGRTVLGMVYLPEFDELYHAEPGRGAWKNGTKRLSVSRTDRLIHALGATGFACVRARIKPDNLPIFNRAIYRIRGIRRLGSAAIDLCLVAEGKFDLYWEIHIQPWDIAAAALIVQEAGGRVTDLDGGPEFELRREILATNGLVHDAFLELVREAHAEAR